MIDLRTHSNEVSRCPFCGGIARIHKEIYGVFIMCEKCLSTSNNYRDKSTAIKAWNNRV